MHFKVDLKNYEREKTIFERRAVRGIIKRGDRYLFVVSKYGDYKFPGGGMEKGEVREETLIREVLEETGYQVIESTIQEYATVEEKRRGGLPNGNSNAADVMVMISYYFTCDVEANRGERNLDDYEVEYDYQVVWMTLEEAIEKNKRVNNIDTCSWVIRELKVMEAMAEIEGN